MTEPSEVAAQMVCCLQGGRPGAKPLLKCTAGHICAEAYSSAPDHMGPADHALTGAHMTSGRTSLHLTVQSDACLLDVQFGVLQGLKQKRSNVALLDSLLGETTTVSSSKWRLLCCLSAYTIEGQYHSFVSPYFLNLLLCLASSQGAASL